ncbi:MAG: CDP-alcohol phosphatidyltransferase family protein [Candidatus Omnitrophica bacterium]|nr:CDP-alcohol phosphatidyltransferase family protein [Candidatus Omnitrophota bacterium]
MQLLKYPYFSLCKKINIHPNWISLLSLLPALIAAVFIVKESYLWAALLASISLIFDLLDGACARLALKASKFGDYIDALVDRYREVIFYFGFVLGGYPLEAFFALSGSLLISFAKARAAMCVPIDDHDWPAIGDMADRNIVLIIGLIGAAIKPVWFLKYDLLTFVLLSIGLFTHIGCVFRIFYAKKIIEKKAPEC